METKKESNQKKTKILFKSYYVVWKLHFKLVVKKLPSLFKSYYVVWKRVGHTYGKSGIDGLNRTM